MQHRQEGAGQDVAAAKAGISVRSGRRIETSTTTHPIQNWNLTLSQLTIHFPEWLDGHISL
jgi:hypothetical protein